MTLAPAETASHELPTYDTASEPPAWWSELVELWRYRDLIAQLAARDVKVRYKRSVLGVAWTMRNPLLMMIVYTVAFSHIFHVSSSNYPVFVLSGTLAWGFFSQTTTVSMHHLLSSGSLLARIYVPRTVFAVSAVLVGLLNLVLALIPLTLLMVVTGAPVSVALAWLPLSMLLLAAFTLGVALILSTLAIRFHDIVDTYQIALSAWFFLTPIIYPQSLVPNGQDWRWMINPMVHLIALFRDPIYEGRSPELLSVALALLVSLGTLVAGWLFFTSRSDELAYRL